MIEEGNTCPKCGKGTLQGPRVFYRVFEKIKQPDFICDKCGAPSWKLPEREPLPFPKEKKKREEQERFDWTRYI